MKNANEIIVDFDRISQDRKIINEEAEKLYNIDYDKILSFSTVYTRNNFKGYKNLLSNLEFLNKREIQHIQDEIDFIVGQNGTGRNEL